MAAIRPRISPGWLALLALGGVVAFAVFNDGGSGESSARLEAKKTCKEAGVEGILDRLQGDLEQCIQEVLGQGGGFERAFVLYDGTTYTQVGKTVADLASEQEEANFVSSGTDSVVIQLLDETGKVFFETETTHGQAGLVALTYKDHGNEQVRFIDSAAGTQTIALQ